jgi:predicted short-subunit dehydrogenase-like oxidoreductase (DUF2520 family)
LFLNKPNIAVVGAGKISYSLVSALIKKGYKVSTVVSKSFSSAKKLSAKFRIPVYSDKYKSLTSGNNLFFIAVPDNQINKAAKKISSLDLDFSNSLFVHVSGAVGVNVLDILNKKKAKTASLHIMQTFPSTNITDIRGCSAAVETESRVAKVFLNKMALELSLKPFYIKPGNKIYYHLAGVFASNFLVGNINASLKMFKLSKAGKTDYYSVMNSAMVSTLDNIKNIGFAKALSGPVERGDYETVASHIKALKEIHGKRSKLLLLNYISQSFFLLDITEEKNGKLKEGHRRIRKILEGELNYLKKLNRYIDK